VKAQPREVSKERATATAKDLKGAGSIQQGEWLKRVGMGVLVSSGIGGLLDVLLHQGKSGINRHCLLNGLRWRPKAYVDAMF
jgi:hypothetical protein